MSRSRFGLVLIALVAALAACSSPQMVGPSAGGDRGTDAPAAPKREGKPRAALDFEVETFEGSTFALSEHRGTPVVVNFWESW